MGACMWAEVCVWGGEGGCTYWFVYISDCRICPEMNAEVSWEAELSGANIQLLPSMLRTDMKKTGT